MAHGESPPPVVGLLNDEELLEALRAGSIFQSGTWRDDGVQQCSYLIRMGRYVDYPRERKNATAPDNGHRVLERHQLDQTARIELSPGDTVLASIQERFNMDSDHMAFTIPRGLLYAESLLVASSYVDPGYSEDFFVPITNVSDRTVLIPYGLPLARIFVFRLSRSVARPYSPGVTSSLGEELEHVRAPEAPTGSMAETMTLEELTDAIRRGVPSGSVIAEAIIRLQVPATPSVPVADISRSTRPELLNLIEQQGAAGLAVAEVLRRTRRQELRLFWTAVVSSAGMATAAVILTSNEKIRQWVGATAWQLTLGAGGSALFAASALLLSKKREGRS